MIKRYVSISCLFWRSSVVQTLREQDDNNSILLAMWFITTENSNSLGLFSAPISQIAHDTLLSKAEVLRCIKVLAGVHFLSYDEDFEWVWVHKAAKHQFALSDERPQIKAKDTRAKRVKRLVIECPSPALKGLAVTYYNDALLMEMDDLVLKAPPRGNIIHSARVE